MKRVFSLTAMIAVFALGAAAAFAATTDKPSDNPGGGNNGQVCPAADSGKIDVSGGTSLTVAAPDGKLISGYCVKAGSANQGLGPEFHSVDPPQKTVTITHSSGKDISHYSLTYVDEGQTTTTETTTTETTTTETTTTETATTETSTTETTPGDTTPGETTPTESTPTETTPAETTPAEESVPADEEQQGVFTPPTQKTSGAEKKQVVATSGHTSAARPSTAAQAPPFTP